MARGARDRGNAPILFFTYVNPIVQYGAERFAAAAREAGALGAIVPDVPLEELDAFAPAFRAAELAIPLLVAPTTPPERAARIAAASDGFVYIVSRLGVTERRSRARCSLDPLGGRRSARGDAAAARRRASESRRPAHVAAIGKIADGVIIGSAFVDATAGPQRQMAARGRARLRCPPARSARAKTSSYSEGFRPEPSGFVRIILSRTLGGSR